MLVEQIFRPSFDAYPGIIALILLPELIRAQTWTLLFLNQIG